MNSPITNNSSKRAGKKEKHASSKAIAYHPKYIDRINAVIKKHGYRTVSEAINHINRVDADKVLYRRGG